MPISRSRRKSGIVGAIRRHRALLGLPLLASLAGCTAAADAGAFWALLLALPLCAGLAYALGALVQRARCQTELRQARAASRGAEALLSAWRWQTDGAHRLVAWQGPGQPLQTRCALFDEQLPLVAGQLRLQERLRAQVPFEAQRLRCAPNFEGHSSWDLRGIPQFDDVGAFSGFVGTALPADEADALRLRASAFVAALDASPLPALLAQQRLNEWELLAVNAAAQRLWPELEPGRKLEALLSQLPAALGAALRQAVAQGPQEQELLGWRMQRLGDGQGPSRSLLLWRGAESVPEPKPTASDSDAYTFTLSHDLRAPIRVVEGFTRIVKEDYGRLLDRVGNDHLDRVLSAAARMNLMIDALLTLARLSQQPLARQRVDLSQLASYVAEELRRAAPERSAEIEIEPGLLAWGDPTLLRMVLENLLGNAWKYSGRCAHTQISLRRVATERGEAFELRDNGAGFDMRSSERLFGLFQRLHSASDFPGHGVGLASVRRIVQRHGGDIWAEAEPGRGAAFQFTLPGPTG